MDWCWLLRLLNRMVFFRRSWGKLGTSHTYIMSPTRDLKSRLLEYDARAVNWYRLHCWLLWKKDGYPWREFYWVTFFLWVHSLHCNVPHHDYADLQNVRSGNYRTIFAAGTSCQNEFILFTHVDDGHRRYIRTTWISDTNFPLKGLGQFQSVMVTVLLYLTTPCSCAEFSGVRAASAIRIDEHFYQTSRRRSLKGGFLNYDSDNVKNITNLNLVHLFFIALIRKFHASNLKMSWL